MNATKIEIPYIIGNTTCDNITNMDKLDSAVLCHDVREKN